MVILDAHQDLFSKKLCGEGVPDWAVQRKSFPKPLKVHIRYDKDGYPLREDCLSIPFSQFYLTYDVMQFQQDFFTNKRGLMDHFVRMWQAVAASMSNQANLLGYQLINQPIGTSVYHDPASLLPGKANNKYLLPAYKRLYEAIHRIDESKIIFFEPSIIDVLGQAFWDLLDKDRSKQVLSYHIYCPLVTALGQPISTSFCYEFDNLQIASKEANIKRMKIGGFMTQFGALSDSAKSTLQLQILLDAMESYFRSWTYWQFKYYNDITTMANPATTQSFYDNDGYLQSEKVKALARPYSTAICGQPILEKFNSKTTIFNYYGLIKTAIINILKSISIQITIQKDSVFNGIIAPYYNTYQVINAPLNKLITLIINPKNQIKHSIQ